MQEQKLTRFTARAVNLVKKKKNTLGGKILFFVFSYIFRSPEESHIFMSYLVYRAILNQQDLY